MGADRRLIQRLEPLERRVHALEEERRQAKAARALAAAFSVPAGATRVDSDSGRPADRFTYQPPEQS
jgi:hypothetical protein